MPWEDTAVLHEFIDYLYNRNTDTGKIASLYCNDHLVTKQWDVSLPNLPAPQAQDMESVLSEFQQLSHLSVEKG